MRCGAKFVDDVGTLRCCTRLASIPAGVHEGACRGPRCPVPRPKPAADGAYKVMFVVRADSREGAVQQAEEYLNTGDRCVDFDVLGPVTNEPGIDPGPTPAPRVVWTEGLVKRTMDDKENEHGTK